METRSEQRITITLNLEEHEAHWLESTMQNPLHGLSVEEEDQQDREYRKIFFDALKKEFNLYGRH